MIRVQVRMPVVTEKGGKKVQRLGEPEVFTFKSRAELNQYMDGILKGCRIKIMQQDTPKTMLKNPMMQRICGMRA